MILTLLHFICIHHFRTSRGIFLLLSTRHQRKSVVRLFLKWKIAYYRSFVVILTIKNTWFDEKSSVNQWLTVSKINKNMIITLDVSWMSKVTLVQYWDGTGVFRYSRVYKLKNEFWVGEILREEVTESVVNKW